MKFSWKIFLMTMFITISCFSLGSYFLINKNFEDSIRYEVKMGYQLCDLIDYSLNRTYKSQPSNYKYFKNEEAIKIIAQDLEVNKINGMSPFRITQQSKKVVYSTLIKEIDNDILNFVTTDNKCYTLKEENRKNYIQSAKMINFDGEQFYIEVLRDVTPIVESQRNQYQIFAQFIVIILIVGGIITSIMSKFLMKPIYKLTKATQEISEGKFEKTIEMSGTDEIAVLSQHFNIMSQNLENKISELNNEIKKRELFVGAFSHELKTPLTSIIGYADMLRSKNMASDAIVTSAQYIFSEGKRLETLSMRLLKLIVIKNQDLQKQTVDAKVFFKDIEDMMGPIVTNNGIKLCMDITPGQLDIDIELIKIVCINLIDNARKAIQGNGVITIIGRKTDKGYCISIKDNGKGIEEKELEKIMQAFYRIESSRSRDVGGAGLGLAICDEILKLHKASVCFQSEVGIGTIVTIELIGEQL